MRAPKAWAAALAAAAGALVAVHLQGCGGGQAACKGGVEEGESCLKTGCCKDAGFTCYKKNDAWASCFKNCTKGLHEDDPAKYRTPWSCEVVSPPKPIKVPHGWIDGTWTTGYWDCCKQSCSWEGKGKVNRPVVACDVRTGDVINDTNEESVCNGGHSATCPTMAPFIVNSGLSMGFAAAAVSGKNGLTGDDNCGQCFELQFSQQRHKAPWDTGPWGGASEDLAGKRMIVQVTNIGYDVTGNHSFDILIPSAGQGIFKTGCTKQFRGFSTEDFDCGKNYGGCKDKDGCEKLPKELQEGCKWRYDWYEWLKEDGQTNNPYVQFHRVRCPHQLVAISGTTPDDDGQHQIVL